MLKLTPTLLGHQTMKLGRFLQIPSTIGLGKCTEMISDINIEVDNFWNGSGLVILGGNWENFEIFAW